MDCNSECAVDTPVSCEGAACGTAIVDDCGVCSLGTTGVAENQDLDCNYDCFGEALIDQCGLCTGGNTGEDFNATFDCANVCWQI